MKKCVVFIDSGVGGVHILNECTKIIGGYKFVYVADNENAPYGQKTKRQLKKIAIELVEVVIKKYKPEVIVFACNTLTVNAIKTVRKKFPSIEFVGVEPALKKAKIFGGDTIILATPATQKKFKNFQKKIVHQLKTEYKLQGLRFRNSGKVYAVSLPNLATQIEENIDNLEVLNFELKKLFSNKKYMLCENIVLGCTHYLAIKKNMQEILGDVRIFDGALSVATRVKSLLKKSVQDKANDIEFVSTGNNSENKNLIKKYYFLIKNN